VGRESSCSHIKEETDIGGAGAEILKTTLSPDGRKEGEKSDIHNKVHRCRRNILEGESSFPSGTIRGIIGTLS
jgi:hypothetical protein